MPLDDLYGDRDRSLSFGSVAEQYDRFRSGYPGRLLDDLTLERPRRVLDVGCGTGKVAVALMARGAGVLGIDPDDRMLEVARRHQINVECATFESWDDAGRRYDLIASGHAWHWVDPSVGADKSARLLVPGGYLARFWNYHAVAAPLFAAFQTIYRELAPEVTVIGGDPSRLPSAPDPLATHPAFVALKPRTYRWSRTMTADEWVALLATFGDHLRMGEVRLTALQDAIRACVNLRAGVVEVSGGTYLLRARRA